MRYSERRERTRRLLERYAHAIRPGTEASVRSMLEHGEPTLAVEDLASALVLAETPLEYGDAAEFRRLLAGFERCPDTPVDIEDLLLSDEVPQRDIASARSTRRTRSP